MTADDLRASPVPPDGLAPPLQALWWVARGDWDRAHACVQDSEAADAAWVHAHLHRREGDLANAAYWYRRAGRPAAGDGLEAEWERLASTLLTTNNG